MRWISCVLIMVLGGCQTLRGSDSWIRTQLPSVWPLWERYQQCRTATDPTQLQAVLDHLEQAMITGVTPPAWIAVFGVQVSRQPLRTSVDPEALAAACTVRAAMVSLGIGRDAEARALYQRVLARYGTQELAYYRDQAIEALRHLDAQLVALRRAPPIR
ncbi:MAG: hypothetical protein Q8N04_01425 [Nitrospira sp.]|nr:hypothetical protein [Nitrospira sp.]